MNSDVNTAAHLSSGANVNDQQKLTGFVEFFTSNLPVGRSLLTC